SLIGAENLETHRRSRKQAALRAALPLSAAAISQYAEKSAHALNALVPSCINEALPAATAPFDLGQPIPVETLEALADFIEYADRLDTSVIEAMIGLIQIHDARIRALVRDNYDPHQTAVVVRSNIEAHVIDAASIYAAADTLYQYARKRT